LYATTNGKSRAFDARFLGSLKQAQHHSKAKGITRGITSDILRAPATTLASLNPRRHRNQSLPSQQLIDEAIKTNP
jgi:hypothetical protein